MGAYDPILVHKGIEFIPGVEPLDPEHKTPGHWEQFKYICTQPGYEQNLCWAQSCYCHSRADFLELLNHWNREGAITGKVLYHYYENV